MIWTPHPAPASRGARVLRHARQETLMTLRNGEQLLLNLVIPVGALVAGMLLGPRFGLDAATFPASIIALAVWSTGFTSLAINTGFERRYGVFERLASTPLSRADLVNGKALATLGIALAQAVILSLVAAALGWRPAFSPASAPAAVLGCVLGLLAFAGLALLLAGRLRAEATLGLANLIYLVVAMGAGVLFPLSAYPGALGGVLGLLPFGALGETLRAAASGVADLRSLLVLAVWSVLTPALARKVFRWLS